MPELTPSTVDRTVVVHRYGVLTWISLAFNALILLLILIGIVCHHHHNQHPEHGGWGGHHEQQGRDNRGHGDSDRHDEGGMHHEWKHHDFDGARGEEHGPGGNDHHGFGKEDHHGWGGDRPGFGGHGPGEMGKPMTPQNAEAMTDRFMLIMTSKLKLTDAESTQIRPIVQDQITQFQKDMEAQKAAHQKMIDDAKAKIRPILTPDQQKQFDQMTARISAKEPASDEKSAPAAK
jgi:hypothetical protein